MTARVRTDFSNIITGAVVGSTPPTIETPANIVLDLVDSSYLNTDTLAEIAGVAATPVAAVFGVPVVCNVNIPDAAGDVTYPIVVPFKCVIINVDVNKAAVGAGNTIKLTTAGDVDITDAIAAAVDKALTHAGTIDPATRDVAAGATLKIVAHRAAGSMACKVRIWVLKTP